MEKTRETRSFGLCKSATPSWFTLSFLADALIQSDLTYDLIICGSTCAKKIVLVYGRFCECVACIWYVTHPFHLRKNVNNVNIYLCLFVVGCTIVCGSFRSIPTWRTRGMRRKCGGWRCMSHLVLWALVYCLYWPSPPFPQSTVPSTGGSSASYRYCFEKTV